MKRFLIVGLCAVLALPVFSTVALAHEADDATSETATTQVKEITTPKTAEELQALKDRITAKKTELKTRLTNAEKLRFQTKCQAAQGRVSAVQGRVKGIETSRGQVYKNIVSRLTALSEKLKNKGINTDQLHTAIDDLEAKITTFNTDLTAYKQAVVDLSSMDCKTDPEGFKAALESARAAREKVHVDGKAIRTHIQDTIKPLLNTIRSQLEAASTEGDE